MSRSRITFRGGLRTVLGFAVAFAAITAIWVPLTAAVLAFPAWVGLVTNIGKYVAIVAVVWMLLRAEGVRFSELGLSRRHLRSALVAFGVFWVAMNAVGVAVAVVTENRWAVSLLWYFPEGDPTVRRYAPLPATWLVLLALEFLVVGPVEELAFRGYLQSKVIALLGGGTRPRVAVGIVVTSVVFGALHTPAAIVTGGTLGGVLGPALTTAVTAVLFGVFYELTHNLWFVALLHGFGNTWPLLVDWATWSGVALVAFWVGAVGVYFGVTLAYRRRLAGSDLALSVDREEVGRSLLG